MNKILSLILIISVAVLLTSTSHAAISGGGIGGADYWKLVGTTLQPVVSAWSVLMGTFFPGGFTNTATSTPQAKGDLIVAASSTAWRNLAVGSDGKVLTASSTAPLGISWETAAGGITSLNGLSGATQTFATSSDTNIGFTIISSGTSHTFTPYWIGTLADGRIGSAATWNAKQSAITLNSSSTGTDFTITNADPTWTFNLPSASASNRGLLTSANWSTFNAKQDALGFTPLNVVSNLSDLASTSTARTNLGLGTAALQNSTYFLQVANNLSDLNSTSTARTNLGIGTAGTQATSFFLQTANNGSDINSTSTFRTNLGLGSIALKATTDYIATSTTATSTWVLTSNGSTWAAGAAGGGGVIEVQTFTASSTWTKPGSGTVAFVQIWGGGGSGGKGVDGKGAGGGGGGSYNSLWIPPSSLGATEAVTIATGGAGQTTAATAGNIGGNTTFGSWLTAYGGGGGSKGADTEDTGGGGGGIYSAGTSGGTSGGIGGNYLGGLAASSATSTGESYAGGGGGGNIGYVGGKSYYGGGGGGAGINTGAGMAGGASVYGGGGGGGGTGVPGSVGNGGISIAGGNGSAGATAATASAAGTQPGGGSGGTETGNSGAGGNGKAIITVF